MSLRTQAGAEAGFTLIELFIVVLIIGILAAIAVPTFFGQVVSAKDGAATSDLAGAKSSLIAYGAAHSGSLTADQTALEHYGLVWSPGVTAAVITLRGHDDFCITATSSSGTAFRVTGSDGPAPGLC